MCCQQDKGFQRLGDAKERDRPGCALWCRTTLHPIAQRSHSLLDDGHQVQKTYDFAGEAVVMTKEVDANSKEAKAYEAEVAKAKAPKKALDGVLSLMKKKTKSKKLTLPL